MTPIASIIKYEGDNSTFVWKHPCEDFNTMSQLIVHESQEAVFMMNGQALDLFGPGRYTLETQNIPLIGKALELATGGETPFHCEVYFINKTVQMAIFWGTSEKVRFIDPLTSVPLELGASGRMNLMVADSRKLLVKLVGTTKGIAWEDGPGFTKSLQASFRPWINSVLKANLGAIIKNNAIDILEVDENLELISARLQEKINAGLEEYGLVAPQFYVTSVVLPEDDLNFMRIRKLHTKELEKQEIQADTTVKTVQEQSKAAIEAARRQVEMERQATETEVAKREAERKVIAAQAEAQAQRMAGLTEAEIMAAKGYTQKDVLQAEVQKAYAEGIGKMGPNVVNGGNGSSVIADMLGLGVGMAAASTIAPQIGGIFQNIKPQENKPADDMAAFKVKVEKLTLMKEAGLLTEEEFQKLKADLLANIL